MEIKEQEFIVTDTELKRIEKYISEQKFSEEKFTLISFIRNLTTSQSQ